MISPQGTTLTFAAVAFPAAAAEQALSLLPLRRRRQRHLRPSPTLSASSSRLNTIAPERLPRKPRLLSMSYSEVCIEEAAQKGFENSAIPRTRESEEDQPSRASHGTSLNPRQSLNSICGLLGKKQHRGGQPLHKTRRLGRDGGRRGAATAWLRRRNAETHRQR